MKRLFILLHILAGCVRPQAQPPSAADRSIRIGRVEGIYSKILGEPRGVLISLPRSYYDTYFYKRRYPVVYMLDGDAQFFSVAAMIREMSEDGMGASFPEMIVVAINNTDRNRDLTPTRDTTEARMGRGADNHSGGGGKFLSFLKEELIPHIDSVLPTAPYRVFIGHSLGGLMVVDAMVNHPGIFNAYLAIDPSMWWDRARLLHQVEASSGASGVSRASRASGRFGGAALFLAGANSLQPGVDTGSVMQDSSNLFSRHMRSIFQLRNLLVRAGASAIAPDVSPIGLRFGWKYYADYSHNTVPLVAEYDGLRQLFDFYHTDLQHDVFETPGFKGDSLLALHFDSISRRMGYKVAPPEQLVNNMGYAMLQRKQMARSWYFFHLNAENYPASFNVYDSMGDWYLANGKKPEAIESFRKALSLRENEDTRKKLEGLEAGK